MIEKDRAEQNRHRYVCILKEIVRGEINEEISGMFDETIEYIEEIRDAIQPLKNLMAAQEELLNIKQRRIANLEQTVEMLYKGQQHIHR